MHIIGLVKRGNMVFVIYIASYTCYNKLMGANGLEKLKPPTPKANKTVMRIIVLKYLMYDLI